MASAVANSLKSVRQKAHIVALLLVLGVGLSLRFRNIRESLPYCGHVDEKTWIQIAWRMMRSGDLNPHRFTKPSLPVYAMLAGSTLGLASSAREGKGRQAKSLGSKAYPFYRLPRAVETPKRLFALVSVFALALLGVVAHVVSDKRNALWLAPLLASVSASYFTLSWEYMNVDILGSFLAWATVAHLVLWHRRAAAAQYLLSDDFLDVAITGALAGAAIGCKYNLGVLLGTTLIGLLVIPARRPAVRVLILMGTTTGVFLATTPYALLDFSKFLQQVLHEVHHYASGHKGSTVPRGWPMFANYWDHFTQDWGWGLVLLSLYGYALLARHSAREFLLVISFPALLFALMLRQKVFFTRNVVTLHLFVALGATLAVLDLPGRLRNRVPDSWLKPPWAKPAAVMGLLAALGLLLPWTSLMRAYRADISSRHTAQRWLLEQPSTQQTLLVDKRLNFDAKPLKGTYKLVVFNSRKLKSPQALREKHGSALAVILDSEEQFYRALEKGGQRMVEFGSRHIKPSKTAVQLDPALAIIRLPKSAH